MPSLVRFLAIVGMLAAGAFAVLYVLATQFEPEPREIAKPVANVKVKK